MCDDVLKQPIQFGVTVQCIVTMTPHVAVHLSINGTCDIPLSSSPPCDGALSHGSCGPYISVAVNTSTCAVFTLTIISDPTLNNINIMVTYPSRFYCLNVEGEWCFVIQRENIVYIRSHNMLPPIVLFCAF